MSDLRFELKLLVDGRVYDHNEDEDWKRFLKLGNVSEALWWLFSPQRFMNAWISAVSVAASSTELFPFSKFLTVDFDVTSPVLRRILLDMNAIYDVAANHVRDVEQLLERVTN